MLSPRQQLLLGSCCLQQLWQSFSAESGCVAILLEDAQLCCMSWLSGELHTECCGGDVQAGVGRGM